MPRPATPRRPRSRTLVVIAIAVATLLAVIFAALRAHAAWRQDYGASAAPARVAQRLTLPPLATTKFHRIDYPALDRRFTQLAGQPGMAGLGVAIVEDGKLSFVKGYGYTDRPEGERVTARTVFRWASLSKGIAATMMAKLADQGRLSLSDPIARWSPSLKLPGGAQATLPIEMIVSHRLGIVHNAYDDRLEGNEDPASIRRLLGALDVYCRPGTCFAYQNVGYDAASEVVAKASRESYQVAVGEALFAPLGMADSSLTRAGLLSSPSWARPHAGSRTLPVEEAYYRVPAAGGMNSSIFDLGLWLRAQMGHSPGVIPRRVLDRLHAPLVHTPRRHPGTPADRAMSEASYGLGWRTYMYAGHRLVGHRGAVRGYRSLILFDPVEQVGVAALWNSESRQPVGMQLEVLDQVYGLPRHDWLELDHPAR